MQPTAESGPARWTWAVPLAALVTALAVVTLNPLALQVVRHATFDQYQRWQPRVDVESNVRIVDIDDESLRRLGQFPWPRTRMAELVTELQRGNAASIALDIVLAEPDRTSPRQLLRDGAVPASLRDTLSTLPDHDQVFADALGRGRTAIGFALTNESSSDSTAERPAVPLQLKSRYVAVGDSPVEQLASFRSSVPSLEVLQRSAAGQGAITFVPDEDGVIRRVPLMASLEGRLVPSLSAEALRLAERVDNYAVRSAPNGGGTIDVRIGRRLVPLDEHGAMWVHYGPRRADRYVPAWKVLAHEVSAAEFAGRVVLVGTSAQGLMDLRFTPLGGITPGVEVHAQAIEQVLAGQSLTRPGWAAGAEWMACLIGGIGVGAVAMLVGAAVSMAAFASLAFLMCAGAWLAFGSIGLLLDPTTPTLALLTVFLPTTVVRHVLSERRQRWVRQAFARYVSPNLVDYLIAHPSALELGGRRQRCSFVFADLAGFTTVMETMDPAAAVGILNEYLDRMIAIAFEHDGTLDRIVGDSVAIVFSAPIEQADHEARALRCAMAMHRFATAHLADLAARGVVFCETRIGVHSGEVTVGNFGGSTIFDYRALGDPVNTASRLEGANKHLGTLVCVSEATLAACPDANARPIGRLVLAGRSEPVMTYEPIEAPAEGDEAYTAAYRLLKSGQATLALAAFERLASSRESDPLIRLHLNRLRSGAVDDLIVLSGK